jgi:hypothetical protein
MDKTCFNSICVSFFRAQGTWPAPSVGAVIGTFLLSEKVRLNQQVMARSVILSDYRKPCERIYIFQCNTTN